METEQLSQARTNDIAGLAVLGLVVLVSLVVEIAAVIAVVLIGAALVTVLAVDRRIGADLPGRSRLVLVALAAGCLTVGAVAARTDPIIAQLGLVGLVSVVVLRWTIDTVGEP